MSYYNNFDYTHRQMKQDCLREVALLDQIRHPNVVTFVDAFKEGSYVFIVLEYCLFDLRFFSHVWDNFHDEGIFLLVYFVLQALSFLHARNIAHLDVCLSNVFGHSLSFCLAVCGGNGFPVVDISGLSSL